MVTPSKNETKQEIITRLNEIMQEMSQKRLQALLTQLDDKPHQWKREHPRKKCSITIEYDTKDYSSTKNIRDLSAGGVYIEAGESFRIGQELTLWLSAPGSQDSPLKVIGTVARRDSNGIGVRFEKLTEHQRQVIKIFEKMKEDFYADAEKNMVRLVVTIAEKVIGKIVNENEKVGRPNVIKISMNKMTNLIVSLIIAE